MSVGFVWAVWDHVMMGFDEESNVGEGCGEGPYASLSFFFLDIYYLFWRNSLVRKSGNEFVSPLINSI